MRKEVMRHGNAIAKIMIVDDNQQNMQLLDDIVMSWNYETFLAYQGRDAIEMATKVLPDAILLDVMLPGMSGYEVCQELRDREKTRNIPIIMISALVDVEDRIHGFRVGADNFLIKPLHYNELRAVLEQLLLKKRWMNHLEERAGVIKVLVSMLQLFAPEYAISLDGVKYQMGKRLTHYLDLDVETTERTLIAILLQNLGRIKMNGDEEKTGTNLIVDLKIGQWLPSLIEYQQREPKEWKNDRLERLELKSLQIEAEIIFFINSYYDILQEKECDEESALRYLQEEIKDKRYNPAILQGLVQVINDKKLMNEMGIRN